MLDYPIKNTIIWHNKSKEIYNDDDDDGAGDSDGDDDDNDDDDDANGTGNDDNVSNAFTPKRVASLNNDNE